MWPLLVLLCSLAPAPARSLPGAPSDSSRDAPPADSLAGSVATPAASVLPGAETPGDRAVAPGGLPPFAAEPGRASRVSPDSSRLRLEVGARSDLTNESYYEDAFIDTIFLGRQRVNTPETRHAGVVAAHWQGTRGHGASEYQLHGEASLGDLLRRGSLGGLWRSRTDSDWTLLLRPTGEYRRDRTLDRELEEWRAALSAAARHALLDGASTVELRLRGDLLRSNGATSDFVPDRNGVELSGVLHHLGLMGPEWEVGYRANARFFPDSAEREHIEQVVDGRWRSAGGGEVALGFDGLVVRRATLREGSSGRDNYWNMEGGVEARLFPASPAPVRLRVGGEAFRYDVEDSTLYFDYDVLRGDVGLRWEQGARWSLTVGPRLEVLSTELNPGEAYLEVAGALEADYFANGSWWSVSPAVGWRDYDDTPAIGPGTPALHSNYAFYDLSLVLDQPLARRWKARVLGTVRWEDHADSAQDAGSIYLTTELRWMP